MNKAFDINIIPKKSIGCYAEFVKYWDWPVQTIGSLRIYQQSVDVVVVRN